MRDLTLINDQGTPMMLMGDEYGHTRYGNNNSYGHDNALNNFQWKEASLLHLALFFFLTTRFFTLLFFFFQIQLEAKKQSHFRFFSEVIKFRHSHHVLKHENFLSKVTN